MYQIKDLGEGSKSVNIIVKLTARAEPRYAKGYKITTFTAGDPTGTIAIPFWNDDGNAVQVGDFIEISSGYVTSFRDQLQLNVGKYGSFQKVDPPVNFGVLNAPIARKEDPGGEITPIEALERQTKHLTVTVFVKDKVEERSVRTRRDGKMHQVSTYLVGDPTGCILLTLWDEWGDLVEVGTSITIEGAFVRAFRGQRFLNLHKGAGITPSKRDVQFSATNNLSEKVVVDFNTTAEGGEVG
ncbi:MAG: hypothetical protein HWN65_14380 [Candidatus Helarchaeota archaeon]|nr:hypothetical protein [Candidatus Helarchaeota archaeon]